MAELHPRLQQDCIRLGRFELCHLLLMNDARYPWCILVPDRDHITEIHQLTETDQQQLIRESSCLAEALVDVFQPDKLNIAAIGNLVPQLHLHHVARFRGDPAWPAPVWGHSPALPYAAAGLHERIDRLQRKLRPRLSPASD